MMRQHNYPRAGSLIRSLAWREFGEMGIVGHHLFQVYTPLRRRGAHHYLAVFAVGPEASRAADPPRTTPADSGSSV